MEALGCRYVEVMMKGMLSDIWSVIGTSFRPGPCIEEITRHKTAPALQSPRSEATLCSCLK